MEKERLFYLDFVRAIATVSIIMTHFNARYLYIHPQMPEKAVLTTTVSNIYIGNWGVSLFFIISGAALMYVYQEKCDIKMFYKKRFLSIYPMFWVAYTIAFLYFFYINKCAPGGGAPKFNIVFSVIGFDGLLVGKYPVFYILGEWFLGVIILMYILFPVLRLLLLNRPVLTGIGIIAIYIWMIFVYNLDFNPSEIIFTRLPEIVFGMYFVKKNIKVTWKMAIAALVILVSNGVFRPEWSSDLQTTYVGIASFIILVFLSYHLKMVIVETFSQAISKYSYAVFLVHHVIIEKMMGTFDLKTITVFQSYLLFITVCAVIAFFSWGLYKLHDNMMGQIYLIVGKNHANKRNRIEGTE